MFHIFPRPLTPPPLPTPPHQALIVLIFPLAPSRQSQLSSVKSSLFEQAASYAFWWLRIFCVLLAARLKVIFNPRTALPQITPYNQNTQTHTHTGLHLLTALISTRGNRQTLGGFSVMSHDGLLLILLSLVNTAADRHKQDLQPPHIITWSLQHRPSHGHTASICTTQEVFLSVCVSKCSCSDICIKVIAHHSLHNTNFLFCLQLLTIEQLPLNTF